MAYVPQKCLKRCADAVIRICSDRGLPGHSAAAGCCSLLGYRKIFLSLQGRTTGEALLPPQTDQPLNLPPLPCQPTAAVPSPQTETAQSFLSHMCLRHPLQPRKLHTLWDETFLYHPSLPVTTGQASLGTTGWHHTTTCGWVALTWVCKTHLNGEATH